MEYIFTLWALWPNGIDSAILRWTVQTILDCERLALWYAATLRADGVDSIAWSCVQQWPI
ncbi:hypothetical protein LCGC14_1676600 [marine sediment metagenome]|uniref:Uncharacterized protein n=1 Tax=marine sediment metagenome TaxID=412755 RepID=A0A0F9KPP9_9ZZZZ